MNRQDLIKRTQEAIEEQQRKEEEKKKAAWEAAQKRLRNAQEMIPEYVETIMSRATEEADSGRCGFQYVLWDTDNMYLVKTEIIAKLRDYELNVVEKEIYDKGCMDFNTNNIRDASKRSELWISW